MTAPTPDRTLIERALKEAKGVVRTLEEQLELLDANILDPTASVIEVFNEGPWTRAAFDRLWGYAASNRGIYSLLSATAEANGEWVPYTKIVQRAGHPAWVQNNAHKTLSNATRNIFTEKRWPVENKQGRARHDNGVAEMIYRMDPRMALWWFDLLKKEGDPFARD